MERKKEININILKSFNLSFGSVYSIKFPKSFIPFNGLKFSLNNHLWEINGIVISSSPSNNVLLNSTEDIWDCKIEPVNHSNLLNEGSYNIIILNPSS